MRISRQWALRIHFILDQLLPPLLRDSRWFMALPFKWLFGDQAGIFFEFKDRAPFLTAEEFRQTYRDAAPAFVQRETDLNPACMSAIEAHVVGDTVLDIACGHGVLARRLAQRYAVTAADIVLDPALVADCSHIRCQEAAVEQLPFPDRAFATVICAHTLEHVQDLAAAIRELRRVAAHRLIIVVPRQRPYRYTFDLHLHFFPCRSSLLLALKPAHRHFHCENLQGDWFYFEDC